MTLLGVDIGTTHVKACAYDEEGKFLGAAHRDTPTRQLQGGSAEYDAHAVEQTVFGVIRQVAEQFGPPQAIGVASMAESGFLVDVAGEPLAPAIAWFDGRTATQFERWRERLDPLDLFSRTGLHLSSRYSACKLEWQRENTPEAWSETVGWLGMAEYLVFRMTGEKSTDPSLATRTMLFNIEEGEWDEKLCALAGVSPDLLPPIYKAGAGPGRLLCYVAADLRVPAGTPVVVCGHDHVCGAFGAGAVEPGEVVDSIGTAESALITLHELPLDETGYNMDLNMGRHVLPDHFYLNAGLPEAGGAVAWLLCLLEGDEEDLARWTEEAGALSPGEGGVFLPLVRGGEERIVLYGLGKDSRPAHLLRAVLEGLTLEINVALRRAIHTAEVQSSGVTVLGGGAKNALWRQLKADVSGQVVRAVSEPECVARGAAMLAGVGAGVFDDYRSVPSPEYEPYTHEPVVDMVVYEQLYRDVHRPLRERLGSLRSIQRTTDRS
ncbi:MAG: FGGY family carbohydrate kinase [Actinomycetota bacterium]|nr:FGGY family carbohydrate kinase [Actinomycetota bacterium]